MERPSTASTRWRRMPSKQDTSLLNSACYAVFCANLHLLKGESEMKKQFSRMILAALILILGVSGAYSHQQAQSTAAKPTAAQAATKASDLVDINSATK